ncbi:uncharacterized protein KNAG_0I02970 [Huiozyma naganishii CBS 8797]|uniref:Ras-GEF domain-containing protein n=1 Tax=Huiozyma naganishii (strain ATCC MYA-139 / BCRC 22969 / CBS 8797 / KCTC 17520 / NBRC 10181 / NCYC 3082 / Yp74L-3) TaxID=1071383 RepID=J7SAE1_HUIN7|nr:hypothetical protein KNAG_0I02970 [Kazachstania naganishii CBS 8797]CCK72081.1 hypothetical protein KNAG_0I02970 [Kazachstania naganishii CBS 8797]
MDFGQSGLNVREGSHDGALSQIKVIDILVVDHDYTSTLPNVLSLKKGEVAFLANKSTTGWLDVLVIMGDPPAQRVSRGWFPHNYTQQIGDVELKRRYSDKLTDSLRRGSRKQSARSSELLLKTTVSNFNLGDDDPLAASDFLFAHEIEELYGNNQFGDLLQENLPVIWATVLTGDKRSPMIYYNDQLNVYCNRLPTLPKSAHRGGGGVGDKPVRLNPKKMPRLTGDDTLYLHTADIKLCRDLFENSLYYCSLAHETFKAKDQLKFVEVIRRFATSVTYITMAVRLFENCINKTARKEIKHLMKCIIKSLSVIKLNANVYFCNKKGYTRTAQQQEYNRTASVATASTMHSDNTLTQATSGNTRNRVLSLADSVSNQERGGADTEPNSKKLDSKHDDYYSTLETTIDTEFFGSPKSIQLLYYVLQNNVTLDSSERHLLPQLFPRFFQDSFNAGSWTNPFAAEHIEEKEKESSCEFAKETKLTKIADPCKNSVSTTTSSTSSSDFPQPSETSTKNTGSRDSKAGTAGPKFNLSTHSPSLSPVASRVLNSTSGSQAAHFSLASNQLQKTKSGPRPRLYPLTRDTLSKMRQSKEQIYDHIVSYIQQTNNVKPDVKMILKIYTEFNDKLLNMAIIENLDLTFFVNLRKILFNNDKCDESIKLLRHSCTTISHLLNEFFNIKQAFHDTVIKLTIVTQHTSTEDPFVFRSMENSHSVGYLEKFPIVTSEKQVHLSQDYDIMADQILKQLWKSDVHISTLEFLDPFAIFKESYIHYYEINSVACNIVERLIEEKENIMNFAARSMQGSLIDMLQKDEYKDARWFEDDFLRKGSDKSDSFMKRASLSGSNAVAWYIQSPVQQDLVFDIKTDTVKSGTLEALVDHLVFGMNNGIIDNLYMGTFLMTFRSIYTSSMDFIVHLTRIYNAFPPSGLSFNEYNEWISKRSLPIKTNIVKVLQSFFTKYWINTYWEPKLDSAIMELVKMAVSEKISGATALMNKCTEIIKNCTNNDGAESIRSVHSVTLRTADWSQSVKKIKKIKAHDISASGFAQQITLMNYEMYSKIELFECLDKIWGKSMNCDFGGSASIANFIEHANLLTNYVSFKIVSEVNMKKRVKLITYFITVALHCHRLSNFATLTAIISALYSSPVFRLKKTWTQVPVDSKDVLNKLDSLMDSKKNFINYRESLKARSRNTPCIPFFGVYLSDLTFANSGNQDWLPVINFRKRFIIADIIRDILRFQRCNYSNFTKNEDISYFITRALQGVPDLEAQYSLSLEVEPRSNSTSKENEKDISFGSAATKFLKVKHGMKLFG